MIFATNCYSVAAMSAIFKAQFPDPVLEGVCPIEVLPSGRAAGDRLLQKVQSHTLPCHQMPRREVPLSLFTALAVQSHAR